MNTRTFIQKLRRHAREHNTGFAVKKHESKGSHRRIYLGNRSTTVPWTSNLKPGLVPRRAQAVGHQGLVPHVSHDLHQRV